MGALGAREVYSTDTTNSQLRSVIGHNDRSRARFRVIPSRWSVAAAGRPSAARRSAAIETGFFPKCQLVDAGGVPAAARGGLGGHGGQHPCGWWLLSGPRSPWPSGTRLVKVTACLPARTHHGHSLRPSATSRASRPVRATHSSSPVCPFAQPIIGFRRRSPREVDKARHRALHGLDISLLAGIPQTQNDCLQEQQLRSMGAASCWSSSAAR